MAYDRKQLRELHRLAGMLLALLIVVNVVTGLNLPIAPFASGDDRIECFPFSEFSYISSLTGS